MQLICFHFILNLVVPKRAKSKFTNVFCPIYNWKINDEANLLFIFHSLAGNLDSKIEFPMSSGR